ncbi:MAG: hypothetical protein MI741_23190 [Rhodospirillales bacterium]|nr:hypothetical protein [Rhodospirillales bacterium]
MLTEAEQARQFDRAIAMAGGKVQEQGPVSELGRPGGLLDQTAAAD